ncbi:MAG: hypothetical protein QOG27_62 [Verrucomicrobiota bacterium]
MGNIGTGAGFWKLAGAWGWVTPGTMGWAWTIGCSLVWFGFGFCPPAMGAWRRASLNVRVAVYASLVIVTLVAPTRSDHSILVIV